MGRAELCLVIVDLRAAVHTTIHLEVVLTCFPESFLRCVEVAKISSVVGVRQPAAGRAVDFMVAVRLGVFVHVVPHQLVLLFRKVQARVDKGPDF